MANLIEVEAIKWTGNNYQEIKEFCGDCVTGNKNAVLFSVDKYLTLKIPKNFYFYKDKDGGIIAEEQHSFEKRYKPISRPDDKE